MGIESEPIKSEKMQAYEAAVALKEKLVNSSSNNPESNRSRINTLKAEIDNLAKDLKLSGELPMNNEEKISFQLDALYPDAKSKTIVEYEGKKYKIRYYAAQESRSGKTVQRWSHKWELVLD
jgi:hypothetical protein